MNNDIPVINTRYDNVNNFINTLAPIVCNEWLRRKEIGDKRISPAVVISQACVESGYNLNASTLFGIKGEGIIADTQEYIDGAYITITDEFQKYENITEAVVGYYDLMQWENYDDATSSNTVEGELDGLTNDIGFPYATSPTYYDTCLSIINDYSLIVFNDFVENYNTFDDKTDNVSGETEENCKTELQLGDKVRVLLNVDYDTDKPFILWYTEYDVLEINGDRVVIGIGDTVTSAIHINNIEKI